MGIFFWWRPEVEHGFCSSSTYTGEISRSAWPLLSEGVHQSFHSNSPHYGDLEKGHQHPLWAGNWAAWVPLQRFWPLSSGFVPSLPPSPSPGAWLRLPRGSCHPPPPPTASFCPPKSSSHPHGTLLGVSGCWGWGHFSSPINQRGQGRARPCHLVTLFPCLSLLWGPAWQLVAAVAAARWPRQ